MSGYRDIVNLIPRNANILLDIGCNNGYISSKAIRIGKTRIAIGVDINKRFVYQGSKLYSDVLFCVADACNLPFRRNVFDAVLMNDVLEHTGEEQKVIQEAWLTLRPKGTLLISTPYAGLFAFMDVSNFRHKFPGLYKRIFNKMSNRNSDTERPVLFHKHYDIEQIEEILGACFSIKNVYRGGLFICPFAAIIDSILDKLLKTLYPRSIRYLFYMLEWADLVMDYEDFSWKIQIVAIKV